MDPQYFKSEHIIIIKALKTANTQFDLSHLKKKIDYNIDLILKRSKNSNLVSEKRSFESILCKFKSLRLKCQHKIGFGNHSGSSNTNLVWENVS